MDKPKSKLFASVTEEQYFIVSEILTRLRHLYPGQSDWDLLTMALASLTPKLLKDLKDHFNDVTNLKVLEPSSFMPQPIFAEAILRLRRASRNFNSYHSLQLASNKAEVARHIELDVDEALQLLETNCHPLVPDNGVHDDKKIGGGQ